MSWNREGQKVTARYLEQFLVSGVVVESRVAYGGSVKHLLRLDEKVKIYGTVRDHLILEDEDFIE